ncbi:MAG: hypothetical protein MUO68_07235, partial [Desulfobacteraceae bacterium]|nr:hypothetical protein [Desulfobacteraceae bacterium]
SATDQKAVSSGLTRVEKPQLFVFLQGSPAGILSQKSSGDYLFISLQSTALSLVTPLYLKNLSLLI